MDLQGFTTLDEVGADDPQVRHQENNFKPTTAAEEIDYLNKILADIEKSNGSDINSNRKKTGCDSDIEGQNLGGNNCFELNSENNGDTGQKPFSAHSNGGENIIGEKDTEGQNYESDDEKKHFSKVQKYIMQDSDLSRVDDVVTQAGDDEHTPVLNVDSGHVLSGVSTEPNLVALSPIPELDFSCQSHPGLDVDLEDDLGDCNLEAISLAALNEAGSSELSPITTDATLVSVISLVDCSAGLESRHYSTGDTSNSYLSGEDVSGLTSGNPVNSDELTFHDIVLGNISNELANSQEPGQVVEDKESNLNQTHIDLSLVKLEPVDADPGEEFECSGFFNDPAEDFKVKEESKVKEEPPDFPLTPTMDKADINLFPVKICKSEGQLSDEPDVEVPSVRYLVEEDKYYSREQITAALIISQSSLAPVIDMDMFPDEGKTRLTLNLICLEDMIHKPSHVVFEDVEIIKLFAMKYGSSYCEWKNVFKYKSPSTRCMGPRKRGGKKDGKDSAPRKTVSAKGKKKKVGPKTCRSPTTKSLKCEVGTNDSSDDKKAVKLTPASTKCPVGRKRKTKKGQQGHESPSKLAVKGEVSLVSGTSGDVKTEETTEEGDNSQASSIGSDAAADMKENEQPDDKPIKKTPQKRRRGKQYEILPNEGNFLKVETKPNIKNSSEISCLQLSNTCEGGSSSSSSISDSVTTGENKLDIKSEGTATVPDVDVKVEPFVLKKTTNKRKLGRLKQPKPEEAFTLNTKPCCVHLEDIAKDTKYKELVQMCLRLICKEMTALTPSESEEGIKVGILPDADGRDEDVPQALTLPESETLFEEENGDATQNSNCSLDVFVNEDESGDGGDDDRPVEGVKEEDGSVEAVKEEDRSVEAEKDEDGSVEVNIGDRLVDVGTGDEMADAESEDNQANTEGENSCYEEEGNESETVEVDEKAVKRRREEEKLGGGGKCLGKGEIELTKEDNTDVERRDRKRSRHAQPRSELRDFRSREDLMKKNNKREKWEKFVDSKSQGRLKFERRTREKERKFQEFKLKRPISVQQEVTRGEMKENNLTSKEVISATTTVTCSSLPSITTFKIPKKKDANVRRPKVEQHSSVLSKREELLVSKRSCGYASNKNVDAESRNSRYRREWNADRRDGRSQNKHVEPVCQPKPQVIEGWAKKNSLQMTGRDARMNVSPVSYVNDNLGSGHNLQKHIPLLERGEKRVPPPQGLSPSVSDRWGMMPPHNTAAEDKGREPSATCKSPMSDNQRSYFKSLSAPPPPVVDNWGLKLHTIDVADDTSYAGDVSPVDSVCSHVDTEDGTTVADPAEKEVEGNNERESVTEIKMNKPEGESTQISESKDNSEAVSEPVTKETSKKKPIECSNVGERYGHLDRKQKLRLYEKMKRCYYEAKKRYHEERGERKRAWYTEYERRKREFYNLKIYLYQEKKKEHEAKKKMLKENKLKNLTHTKETPKETARSWSVFDNAQDSVDEDADDNDHSAEHDEEMPYSPTGSPILALADTDIAENLIDTRGSFIKSGSGGKAPPKVAALNAVTSLDTKNLKLFVMSALNSYNDGLVPEASNKTSSASVVPKSICQDGKSHVSTPEPGSTLGQSSVPVSSSIESSSRIPLLSTVSSPLEISPRVPPLLTVSSSIPIPPVTLDPPPLSVPPSPLSVPPPPLSVPSSPLSVPQPPLPCSSQPHDTSSSSVSLAQSEVSRESVTSKFSSGSLLLAQPPQPIPSPVATPSPSLPCALVISIYKPPIPCPPPNEPSPPPPLPSVVKGNQVPPMPHELIPPPRPPSKLFEFVGRHGAPHVSRQDYTLDDIEEVPMDIESDSEASVGDDDDDDDDDDDGKYLATFGVFLDGSSSETGHEDYDSLELKSENLHKLVCKLMGTSKKEESSFGIHRYQEIQNSSGNTPVTVDGRDSHPATPGTLPATPGTLPATPGTLPATPGTLPATPGTLPATPGTLPATPGTLPATPGALSATPGTFLGTPGTHTATPGSSSNAKLDGRTEDASDLKAMSPKETPKKLFCVDEILMSVEAADQKSELEVVYSDVRERFAGTEKIMDEVPKYYQKVPLAQAVVDKCKDIPLVGLQYVLEVRKDVDMTLDGCYYICAVCSKKMNAHTLIAHVKSVPHRLKFSETHCRDIFEKYGTYSLKQWTATLVKEFTVALSEVEVKMGRHKLAVAYERDISSVLASLKQKINEFGQLSEPKKKNGEERESEPVSLTSSTLDAKLPPETIPLPPFNNTPKDETPLTKETSPTPDLPEEDQDSSTKPEAIDLVNDDVEIIEVKKTEGKFSTTGQGYRKRNYRPGPNSGHKSSSRSPSRSVSPAGKARTGSPSPKRRRGSHSPYNKQAKRGTDQGKSSRSGTRKRRHSRSPTPPPGHHPDSQSRSSHSRHGPRRRSRSRHRSPRSPTRRKDRSTQRSSHSSRKRDSPDDRSRRITERKLQEFRAAEARIRAQRINKEIAYEKNPESYPDYNHEWKRFWERRCFELEAQGIDPFQYDFKSEWADYWRKRIKDLTASRFKSSRDALLQRMNMDDPDLILKEDIDNKKASDKGSNSKWNTENPKGEVVSRIDRSPSPWEQEGVVGSTAKNPSPPKNIESSDIEPAKSYEEEFSVIGTLKILNELEDQLGSFGPAITILLEKAIECKKKSGNAMELFNDPDNLVLVRYAREKLSSQVSAGILGVSALVRTQMAVERAMWVQSEAEKLSNKEKYLGLDIASIARATLGKDKIQIAQFIAQHLLQVGNSNASEEDLQNILIAVSAAHSKIIIDQATKQAQSRTNGVEATADSTQSSHPVSPSKEIPQRTSSTSSEASRTPQPLFPSATHSSVSKSPPSVGAGLSLLQTAYEEDAVKDMGKLSLEDLQSLLANFRSLVPEEQHALTAYLKKLEATDSKKVMKLRAEMQKNAKNSLKKTLITSKTVSLQKLSMKLTKDLAVKNNVQSPSTNISASQPPIGASPQTSQQPAGASTPQPSQQPAGASTPQPSQQPVGASTPQPSQHLAGASTPQPSQRPAGASTPQPSQRPAGASTPQPSQQPIGASTPQPSQQPVGASPQLIQQPAGASTPQPNQQPAGTYSPQPNQQPTGTCPPQLNQPPRAFPPNPCQQFAGGYPPQLSQYPRSQLGQQPGHTQPQTNQQPPRAFPPRPMNLGSVNAPDLYKQSLIKGFRENQSVEPANQEPFGYHGRSQSPRSFQGRSQSPHNFQGRTRSPPNFQGRSKSPLSLTEALKEFTCPDDRQNTNSITNVPFGNRQQSYLGPERPFMDRDYSLKNYREFGGQEYRSNDYSKPFEQGAYERHNTPGGSQGFDRPGNMGRQDYSADYDRTYPPQGGPFTNNPARQYEDEIYDDQPKSNYGPPLQFHSRGFKNSFRGRPPMRGRPGGQPHYDQSW